MMSSEDLETRRFEEEAAKRAANEQHGSGKSEEDPLITKSEMRNEMRCMLQELMGLGMIGSKMVSGASELKLELVPNDVKLEGSKNYLSWSRRVQVLLGDKGVEHYIWRRAVLNLLRDTTLNGRFGIPPTLLLWHGCWHPCHRL
jgi:hypothetical protein